MKNWTPRKWASRRKQGKRPRFFMRRDQAQAKERAQTQRHRQRKRRQTRRALTDGDNISAERIQTPLIAG